MAKRGGRCRERNGARSSAPRRYAGELKGAENFAIRADDAGSPPGFSRVADPDLRLTGSGGEMG